MRDDDLVSMVVFQQNNDSPVDPKQVSPVHFVSVKEMRKAFTAGVYNSTEGSRRRLGNPVMWMCAAANQKAVVSEVESRRSA